MSLFEFNKILATLIIAIIVFVFIGYLGNILINPKNPKELAYKIDIRKILLNLYLLYLLVLQLKMVQRFQKNALLVIVLKKENQIK